MDVTWLVVLHAALISFLHVAKITVKCKKRLLVLVFNVQDIILSQLLQLCQMLL